MNHIMVDLETLATTADAVILSIGAVKFDLLTGKIDDAGFYRSISIESNLDYKRRISEDTLKWWVQQSPEAQKVFFEPKEHLPEAMTEFSSWVGKNDYQVWANGADFDIPMLAHAFTQLQIDIPWKFWNSRCFRTYKQLPGAKAVVTPFTGVKHNALSDAYSQAVHLCAIHSQLFPATKKATQR